MENVTGRLIFPGLKQLRLHLIFFCLLSSLGTLSPSSCFLGQSLPKNTYSELQILLSIQFLKIKKLRKGMGEGLISPHTNSLHLLGTDDGPTVSLVCCCTLRNNYLKLGIKRCLQNTANYCLHFKNGNMPAHTNFFRPMNYRVSMKFKVTLHY